jgi:hypothetical protein
MTLTDMAKQLNVSTMTIYRRCEKNGVVIGDLRDSSTGKLTSEGVAVIASLFDTTTPQKAITDDTTRTPHEHNDDTQHAAQAACDVLQARLDGANAIIEQLTGERDDLRRQVAALTAALQAEQADRQAERRLLTGGDLAEAAEPRRHWWQRWRR